MTAARHLAVGAGAALALFHAWLLGGQFASGQLADPALAVRWIIAGALIAPLAWLWRRGESLIGRKAVAVWALAAMLHGPAIADRQSGAVTIPSLPEAVTTVLQFVAAAAGLGVLLLAALARRVSARAPAFSRTSHRHHAGSILHRPSSHAFAPRPPPRA